MVATEIAHYHVVRTQTAMTGALLWFDSMTTSAYLCQIRFTISKQLNSHLQRHLARYDERLKFQIIALFSLYFILLHSHC